MAGKSTNVRSYAVYLYGSGQPYTWTTPAGWMHILSKKLCYTNSKCTRYCALDNVQAEQILLEPNFGCSIWGSLRIRSDIRIKPLFHSYVIVVSLQKWRNFCLFLFTFAAASEAGSRPASTTSSIIPGIPGWSPKNKYSVERLLLDRKSTRLNSSH